MNAIKYKEKIITTVAEEMLSFMNDCEEDGGDAGFTANDVEECKEILFNYVDALAELEDPTDDEILAEVETAVVALNELNENADYTLIETVEREAIWEIIQDAAVECGLEEEYDDVTEEWREW